MRAADILGTRLRTEPEDERKLAFLAPALQRIGYTEEKLCELLGLPNLYLFAYARLARASFFWRCLQGGELGWMAMLWLFAQRIPRAEAENVLTAEGTRLLIDKGLLSAQEDGVESAFDLYPCLGTYVFTDRALAQTKPTNTVYELGADSYTLARTVPKRGKTALDLCTGSGIHAIRAARHHAERAVGLDVKLRPLQFAAFNAALNGVRCEFQHSDLYAAVKGQKFELITANPAWVPAPDPTMQTYRWGGETGERVTHRVAAGADEHLTEDGLLAMKVVYPIIEGSSYVERLKQCLEGGPWGITHIETARVLPTEFVGLHVGGDWSTYDREVYRYLESYKRQKFVAIGGGMTFLRRSARPFTVELQRSEPTHDISDYIDALLDAQDSFLGGTATLDRPRLSPAVKHVWLNENGEGAVQYHDAYHPPEPLTKEEAAAMRGLSGEDEVLRRLAARYLLI